MYAGPTEEPPQTLSLEEEEHEIPQTKSSFSLSPKVDMRQRQLIQLLLVGNLFYKNPISSGRVENHLPTYRTRYLQQKLFGSIRYVFSFFIFWPPGRLPVKLPASAYPSPFPHSLSAIGIHGRPLSLAPLFLYMTLPTSVPHIGPLSFHAHLACHGVMRFCNPFVHFCALRLQPRCCPPPFSNIRICISAFACT